MTSHFELFQRLIIAAGMLWIPVKTGLSQCMPTPTKGKFKSFLLHHSPSNSKPFLKVEVGSNNNVTGIAFVGDHNQPNVTGKEARVYICLF